VGVFGISWPQIGPSELMSATLTACHSIKRCPFGLLFVVSDKPRALLAGTEATRDCPLSTESCMDVLRVDSGDERPSVLNTLTVFVED